MAQVISVVPEMDEVFSVVPKMVELLSVVPETARVFGGEMSRSAERDQERH